MDPKMITPYEATVDPAVLAVDQEMLKLTPPVYVFNVSHANHSKSLGGLGTFTVAACEKGQRVSKPLVISGLYPQHSTIGDARIPSYIRGTVLADDFLGISSTLPSLAEFTTNFEWKGCFKSMNAVPTDEEVAKANGKLKQYRMFFVEDGDRRSMLGPGDNGMGGISKNHREALKELNVKRSWADAVVAQEECAGCGSAIKANIARCPHCSAMVDEKLYAKHFPAEYAARCLAVESANRPAESAPVAQQEPAKQTPIYDRSKQGK